VSQDIGEHGWTTTKAGGESFWFWCAPCDTHHRYVTKLGEGETGPCWQTSGPRDKPTFTPSLLCNRNLTEEHRAAGGHRCHLYFTDGTVRYLGDCTHDLAGKTVPFESAKF